VTEEAGSVVTENGLDFAYAGGGDIGAMVLAMARYAFVTFVVILALWLFMQFLRRALDSASWRGSRGRIQVLESTRLYGDKVLHIVRVDNREVLIGSSKDCLTYLGDLGSSQKQFSSAEETTTEDVATAGEPDAVREGVGRVAGRAGYDPREAMVSWVARATSRVSGWLGRVSRRGKPGQTDDEPDEVSILRKEAQRVKQNLKAFREILDDQMSAGERGHHTGQQTKLERLKSLAAATRRRDTDG